MQAARFNTRDLVMVPLFTAIMIALGFLYIPLPFTPVPITGQSLGAMLAGSILGAKRGALSMVVFLALVAVGAPVLAGGRGGFGILVGPSGGYILGFLLGAFLVGLLTQALRNRRGGFWWILISNGIGGIVGIHAPGIVWLSVVTHRSLFDALMVGSVPFLPGDMLKILAAAVIAQGVFAAYPMERLFAHGKPSPSESS
ncbi:MAG: biotin transporter BioY [Chloroflexota bacterium]|nr:MAG: biotin transporter BioY [Chloroflexota bacterium]